MLSFWDLRAYKPESAEQDEGRGRGFDFLKWTGKLMFTQKKTGPRHAERREKEP